jgi:hypothetical protein
MERETGIEPASLAWKARVLPLNYSRIGKNLCAFSSTSDRAELLCTITHSLVEGTGFEPV